MAPQKNDEKFDAGVWQGEVTATLKAIQGGQEVLFRKLEDHVKEDKDEFDKADKARAAQAEKTGNVFTELTNRIGKSEIRLAVVGAIGSIVFAIILTIGPYVLDAWHGKGEDVDDSVGSVVGAKP